MSVLTAEEENARLAERQEEDDEVDDEVVVTTAVEDVPLGLGQGDDTPITEEKLKEMVASLNTEQRRVFDRTIAACHHTADHMKDEDHCKNYNPLHLFCTGVGGVGKSYLIKVIVAQLTHDFKTENR